MWSGAARLRNAVRISPISPYDTAVWASLRGPPADAVLVRLERCYLEGSGAEGVLVAKHSRTTRDQLARDRGWLPELIEGEAYPASSRRMPQPLRVRYRAIVKLLGEHIPDREDRVAERSDPQRDLYPSETAISEKDERRLRRLPLSSPALRVPYRRHG